MSPWRRETLSIGIDATSIVVKSRDALEIQALDGPIAPLDRAAGSNHPAGAALREQLRRRARPGRKPGGAASVLVGADLCRHWSMTAPSGVSSLGELQRIALLRCVQLFGGSAGDWAVVADWSLDRPYACAALPRHLLDALCVAAAEAGVQLRVQSAMLAGVRQLERWMPQDGWYAWPMPSVVVLVRQQRDRVVGMHTFRRAPDAAAAELAAEAVRRVVGDSLRSGDPRPRTLAWLDNNGIAVDDDAATDPAVTPVTGVPAWLSTDSPASEAQWAASLPSAA